MPGKRDATSPHRGHRPQRGRRREQVADLVLLEHVERLRGVVAALAAEHRDRRPEPPRPEDAGHDAGDPGPLAGRVEDLVVAHVVDVLELVVGEEVAVRVDDPLRQPGRAGRVVDLGGLVGRGVERREDVRRPRDRLAELAVDDQHVLSSGSSSRTRSMRSRVGGVGHDHLRPAVAQAVDDRVVAVEDRQREQDRPELVRREERRRGSPGAAAASRRPGRPPRPRPPAGRSRCGW